MRLSFVFVVCLFVGFWWGFAVVVVVVVVVCGGGGGVVFCSLFVCFWSSTTFPFVFGDLSHTTNEQKYEDDHQCAGSFRSLSKTGHSTLDFRAQHGLSRCQCK